MIQEWFARDAAYPPVGLMAHGAWEAITDNSRRPWVVWIGRACWPYPSAAPRLLPRSIFVDPPDLGARLWAIDLAARCPAVGVVVADGRKLGMAATRRLQLAAKAGGACVMLAREMGELKELSAASMRWIVRPVVTNDVYPRWESELVRWKSTGGNLGREALTTKWTWEWNHEKGLICLSADVRRGSDRAGAAAGLPVRQAG